MRTLIRTALLIATFVTVRHSLSAPVRGSRPKPDMISINVSTLFAGGQRAFDLQMQINQGMNQVQFSCELVAGFGTVFSSNPIVPVQAGSLEIAAKLAISPYVVTGPPASSNNLNPGFVVVQIGQNRYNVQRVECTQATTSSI